MLKLYRFSLTALTACVMGSTSMAAPESTPLEVDDHPLFPPVMTTDFIRVTSSRISIPIGNPIITAEVGKYMMLIQENDDFFITMCSNQYQGVFLAAFPTTTREGRPAWITPEQKVFFAYRTASCPGALYFRQGDELPVDAQTHSAYKLRLDRFDHVFPLYLSKTNSGYEFCKAPSSPMVASPVTEKPLKKPSPSQKAWIAPLPKTTTSAMPTRPPPVKRYIVTPVGTSTNVFAITLTEPAEKIAKKEGDKGFLGGIFSHDDKNKTVAEKPKESTSTKTKSPNVSVASVVETQVVQKTAVTENVVSASSPSTHVQAMTAGTLTSQTNPPSASTSTRKGHTPIFVFLALAVFIVGLFWERRRKEHERARAIEAAAKTLAATADNASGPPPIPTTLNDFSGSIASMSLGSVTQFLNSDKETGTLFVRDKGNAELGTLVFIKGEIVDAKSLTKRGLDALHEILRNKEGFFSFLREEPKDVETTITTGTISVLLDAHRMMDEELKESTPPTPPPTPAPAPKASRLAVKSAAKLKLHGNR